MTLSNHTNIPKKSEGEVFSEIRIEQTIISPAMLVKNSFLLILLQVLTKITGFITSILLANYLGTSLFGVYSYAFALSAIFIPFCDFGLDILLMKEMVKNPLDISKKYLGSTLRLKAIFALILTITIILLAGILESFHTEEFKIVVFSGLITILRTFSNTYGSTFKAINKVGLEVISFSILRIIEFSLVIYVVFASLELLTLLILLFTINFFGVGFIFKVIWNIIKPDFHFDTTFCRKILHQSAPFALIAILSAIYFNIGTVLISKITGDEYAGLYRSVYNIIFPLTIFSMTISSAIFPYTAQNFLQNKKQVSMVVSKIIKYFIIATVPMSLLITFFSTNIVGSLFASEYATAAPTLSILGWLLPAIFLTNFSGTILGAVDEQNYVLKIIGINVLINLLFNIILISAFYHNGAAVAAVLTEIIAVTFFTLKVWRKFEISREQFKLLPFIILLLLTLLSIQTKLYVSPIAAAAGSIIIYLSGLFLFRIITRSELAEIKNILLKR